MAHARGHRTAGTFIIPRVFRTTGVSHDHFACCLLILSAPGTTSNRNVKGFFAAYASPGVSAAVRLHDGWFVDPGGGRSFLRFNAHIPLAFLFVSCALVRAFARRRRVVLLPRHCYVSELQVPPGRRWPHDRYKVCLQTVSSLAFNGVRNANSATPALHPFVA